MYYGLAFKIKKALSLNSAANQRHRPRIHNSVHIRENIVIRKSLGRVVLIVVISIALAAPAKADNLDNAARNIVIGIVVVVAAIVVVAIVLVRHEAGKDRTITGCVSSAGSGLTIADENDKQIYALAGNTVGITPGDRMKLKGKKVKSKGPNHTYVLVATKVTKDFGVCQP